MTTQFASASYQEVVDLHTESDTVSVIGIHTPQGDTPRKMFGGFFEQFKKFKYLGCSIKLVPAARLPADPLQVSYDAGEPTIDPRDMLNPLMFHGCHGNDMGVILNRLYALNSGDMNSDSINFIQDDTQWSLAGIANGEFPNFQLEDLYYKALTDNTWKKAHPQRGFRKSGLRPLVYKMATNLQMLGTGSSLAGEVGVDGIPMGPAYDSGSISLPVTQSGRQFFTPGLTGLGWLDTRNVLTDFKAVDIDLPITEEELPDLENAIRSATLAQQNASESSLPLVYMGMILLPPAYKTEQYFRMVINHHFAFKDFRGISFSNNLATTPAYSNFNDEDFQQGGDEVDPDDPSSGGDDSGGGSTGGVVPTDVNLYGMNLYRIDETNYYFNSKLGYKLDNVAVDYVLSSTSSNIERYYFVAVNSDKSGFVVNTSSATKTVENKMVGLLLNNRTSGQWYIYLGGFWYRCDYDGSTIVTSETVAITPSYISVTGGTLDDVLAFMDDYVYAQVTISDSKVTS